MADQNVVTLVSALDEAGMFLVFATRTYRFNLRSEPSQRQCLCPVFHAAGLWDSRELFVEMQDALAASGSDGFEPGERGVRVVNGHELLFLAALAHWQKHPGDLSDHVLEWLPPTVRRIAAPLAREFARRMAQAGLRLEARLPRAATLNRTPPPHSATSQMH